MAAPKAAVCRLRGVRTSKRADKSSPASTQNFMERINLLKSHAAHSTTQHQVEKLLSLKLQQMPREILIRILSYLDASTLFSIGHVNKHFYQLASDDSLWNKLCMAQFGKHKMCELAVKLQTQMQLQDGAAGQWKRFYFQATAARDVQRCRRLLQLVSPHTGLPSQIERVLRNLHVTWDLTVTEKSGRETTLDLSWSQFAETYVTLCWSVGGHMPNYQQISTLHLHGVRRIRLNCPGLKPPGCRSLLATVDMQTLSERAQVVGRSKIVELKLLQPGAAIGVWKGEQSVAFILFTLHFNSMLQRSAQGSFLCPHVEPTVQPPSHDVDPEYGLHGYHLHVVLHNSVCELMSESFSQLFCRRSQISDGLIQLIAINRTNLSQHTRLSGGITLQWQIEALQGVMENCCVMSLTLLDEFRKPFKCVSSPVCMEPEEKPVSYDYDGEHYLIHYQDSDSQVKMNLVLREGEQQFFIVSLVVYLSVCSVNKHFGCDY